MDTIIKPVNNQGLYMSGTDPEEGVRWHPPPDDFEISSPRKHDFHHSEAESACFGYELLRVLRMTVFLKLFTSF